MVDFRARYDPTAMNKELIDAMAAKAGQRNPLSVALESGMSGIEKGLQLSETVGKIKADRERKKALAQYLISEEGQKIGELGNILSPEQIGNYILKSRATEAENVLKAPQANLAQEKARTQGMINDLYEIQKTRDLTPREKALQESLLKRSSEYGLYDYMRDVTLGQGGTKNRTSRTYGE